MPAEEKYELIKDGEINLKLLVKEIINNRRTIYKTVAVFFVFGLIIAFGTPKEYKSEVTLLIETDSKSNMSGLLQQFGGLAGINLGGSGTDALGSPLYSDVIKSTPFLLEVLNKKVRESKYDSIVTVSQYFERHTRSSVMSYLIDFTIGLPGKIVGWIKGEPKNERTDTRQSGFNRISRKQLTLSTTLANCINAKEGTLKGTYLISAEMQDPFVAAELTDTVVKCLTNYIIDYHTQKVKSDLKFVSDRFAEAATKYFSSQRALAVYRDQNKNIILASARAEEERLQYEFNLTFNIYSTLSQQLEQAKIKVQENTPVFKVINPALVPFDKSKPKTILILGIFTFFGIIVSIGFIIGKLIVINFRIKIVTAK